MQYWSKTGLSSLSSLSINRTLTSLTVLTKYHPVKVIEGQLDSPLRARACTCVRERSRLRNCERALAPGRAEYNYKYIRLICFARNGQNTHKAIFGNFPSGKEITKKFRLCQNFGLLSETARERKRGASTASVCGLTKRKAGFNHE